MGTFWQNPILLKELRERMRTMRSGWLILLYLAVTGITALSGLFLSTLRNPNFFNPNVSFDSFMGLTVVQLGVIAFVVPGLVAGAISGERERQTLGVLLTTPLSSFTIIASKLMTSLAFTILLLITSLPIYGVILQYGGVAPWQMWAVFGIYFVTVVSIGCIGLFCSVLTKRTGASTILTYGIVFGIGIGTFLLGEFLRQWLWFHPPVASAALFKGAFNTPTVPEHYSVWPLVIQSFNAVLIILSIFDSHRFGFPNANQSLPFAPWAVYTIGFLLISSLLIWLSARLLRHRAAGK